MTLPSSPVPGTFPETSPDASPGTAPRAAAFFDLDKTLLATTTPTAFARAFHRAGMLSRRTMLRSARVQADYLFRGADAARTERLKQQMTHVIAGWDVARMTAVITESLERSVRPMLYREAVELVRQHRAAGRAVVVVSASAEEMVRPVAALVGADDVLASRLHQEDGRYTGGVDLYCYGPQKVAAMQALAAVHGWDLASSYAYSDSITDVPMLAAVGHAAVVNPDAALRRRAETEGWERLRFRRPQPIAGIPAGPGTLARVAAGMLGVLAAGALVVAAGLAVAGRLRDPSRSAA